MHKGDKADPDCPHQGFAVCGRSKIITLESGEGNCKDSTPKVVDQASPCISHIEHASTQAAEILILLTDRLPQRYRHHHLPASASFSVSQAVRFLNTRELLLYNHGYQSP